MKTRLAAIVVAMLPCTGLLAEAPKPTLRVQADLITSRATTGPTSRPARQALLVHLVNEGSEPVTVLTEKLNRSTGGNDITIGYTSTVKKDGRLIVPSLPSLAPVVLKPGEMAMLPGPVELTGDVAGEIRVFYTVLPEWGERFGVWSGTVQCVATPISLKL